MRRGRTWIAALLGVVVLAIALAQDDRFGFLPPGGQQLLEQALASCEGCEGLDAWTAADRTESEWRSFLEDHGLLAELDDVAIDTLTRYLSVAFPMEEPVSSVANLPLDGRTLVIFQCQTCHAITIPVTQDREVPYWLQHRTQPPHDALELSEAEWQHVANYLALNTPIDEASIPAELRQGAGGY